MSDSAKVTTPKRINVIEYKGQLFKTQEEYNAYIRKELKETLYTLTNSKLKAAQFLQALIDDAINTKAKLEALQKEIEEEDKADFEEANFVPTPGVNCNEEPDDEKEEESY